MGTSRFVQNVGRLRAVPSLLPNPGRAWQSGVGGAWTRAARSSHRWSSSARMGAASSHHLTSQTGARSSRRLLGTQASALPSARPTARQTARPTAGVDPHIGFGTRGICSSPAPSLLRTELVAPNGVRWEQPLGLFIGNEFCEGGGERIMTVNPFTEEEICPVAAANEADVDRAVDAAQKALHHPSWKSLSGSDRGLLMNKLADLIDQHADTLAAIETLDNGKSITESRNFAIPDLSKVLRYYAGWADKNHGSVIDIGPAKFAYTTKRPVGVCGQIIPWNYPLELAGWKLGPALACGNTVVMKPSELTPLSALYLAQLIRDAGFPPGVVNIVNGVGSITGEALVRHPGVHKIALTGSTATGKHVMRCAAETMKAVTLETGGKSPLIVFDDANIEQAVREAWVGVMTNQGQICTATTRVLVQDGVYEQFLSDFVAYTARRSVLGDPFDPATSQGPQISHAHRERVMAHITAARASGARVIHPAGEAVPARGFFIPPTIFTDLEPGCAALREEIFGPCVAVMRFSSEEEALKEANATRYGLASAVFTRDVVRAHRVSAELEAGMVWVNSSPESDYRVPFGGTKESGVGRELGEEGLRGYYTVKATQLNLGE